MSKAFYHRKKGPFDPKSKGCQETAGAGLSHSYELLIKHLSSEDVVLDIACGSGKRTCEIARYVKQVTGIGKSKKKVKLATWRAEQSQLSKLQFHVADVFDESITGRKFSAIVALNAFDSGDDPAVIIPQLNRLLARGGKLLLQYPCLGEGFSLTRNIRALLSRIRWVSPCSSLSVAELENMVTGANFRIEEGFFTNIVTPNYFILASKQ